MCFIVLFLALKIYAFGGIRGIDWRLENLENINEVKAKIRRLDEIKYRASVSGKGKQPVGWGNLWGLM